MRWFNVIVAAGVVGALTSFITSAMVRCVTEVDLIINTLRGVGLVLMAVIIYETFIHDLRVGWVSTYLGLGVPAGKLMLERLTTYYLSAIAFIMGGALASTELLAPGLTERLTLQFLGDVAIVALATLPLALCVPVLRNEFIILLGAVLGGARQYLGLALGAVLRSAGLVGWAVMGIHAWYPALALSATPALRLPLTDAVAALLTDAALIALSLLMPYYAFLRRCVRL